MPRTLALPPEFWETTSTLRSIRDAGYAESTSPEPALGAHLALAGWMTPYGIHLPSFGNLGSLNVSIALVTPTGGGKSSSVRIARDQTPASHYMQKPCVCASGHAGPRIVTDGTGEGLIGAFLEDVTLDTGNEKPNAPRVLKLDRHEVLAIVDEVATVTATSIRSGGGMRGAIERSLWSGGDVGQALGTRGNSRSLPAGEYRFASITNVQPELAGPLFADTAAGSPGRFLWFPGTGAGVPRLADGDTLPAPPGLLPVWRPDPATIVSLDPDPVRLFRGVPDDYEISLADSVRDAVRVAVNEAGTNPGAVDPLDGHRRSSG